MTIKLWKLVFQAVDLQTKQLPELRYCKKSWDLILADLVPLDLMLLSDYIFSGMMRRCQSTV